MAGFDDGFQVAVKQLGFEGVIRIGFVAQAADIVRHVVRSAKQRDDLIERMHAQTIE